MLFNNTSIRLMIVLACIGLCSTICLAAPPPNVIILLADDLGSKDIGCYGGPVKTPVLDALAAKGVRFTDFHAGAAVCSPSRATLMTGRQHIRAGIYGVLQDSMHKSHLLEREVTIAEVLKQAGYSTAHFGKWHMGMTDGPRKKPSPLEHGFDYWFGLRNGAGPSHKDPVNFMRNGKRVGPMKGYSCQIVVDDAIRWLEKDRAANKPFFLNIWFNEPHSVIAAPDEIVKRYGELGDQAAIYSATVDNTDRAIGRLTKKLKAMGELENTLIIYSSDHGSYRDDRNGGLRGAKGSLFQGGLRSPGIFFWPRGIPAGRVVKEPSGAVDLLPTICALTGVPTPMSVHLDGANLAPLLTGRGEFKRSQLLFWHSPTNSNAAVVRDGRYALMAYRDYELPQDHAAMNAILKRIGELVSVNEREGAGNLRSCVFNGTIDHPEAKQLQWRYVQLNTFQESWIPIIKKGGFSRFVLFDLESDPQQKADISKKHPEITDRLKKSLLEINASVMADAPDWLTAQEIAAEKESHKALAASFGKSSGKSPTQKPRTFWEKIETRPLPKDYHGSRHQVFVDAQMARMTLQQQSRVGQLWKEKRRIDPDMKNRGASFVKILMFVAEGEKDGGKPSVNKRQSKAWFREREKANQPLVKAVQPDGVIDEPGHPTLLSPHSDPITLHGGRLFVVNTPADTLDVIDTNTDRVVNRIPVGIDPVCVKVRPDGREIWVSNHISDSVSVIDNDPISPTYLTVVATIQDIDLRKKSTRFDEPVGIAFADNSKAYVALAPTNRIAVIDVASRRVIKHLSITAQDPRSLRVHDGHLYVIPFESNNQTQLSGGDEKDIDGRQVTFDAQKLFSAFDSAGFIVDVVKHQDIPDRDLYVFDTKTDKLVRTVNSLGTLLYGLDVDSKGNILIAHTDARNHVNGRAGTKKHGLKEFENRPYLNRLARVSTDGTKQFISLNPLPPKQPDRKSAIATPFAVRAADDAIYLTAAGSDHLVVLDPVTDDVVRRVKVGAVPRGIALQFKENKPRYAWVFNAVDNSVSKVDVSSPRQSKVTNTITLYDPTPKVYKAGRIAFNTARASSNGTFSCASCHPDGHTDQLLWVLDTPHIVGADQIEPRLAQQLRGLRGTAPYHWDGVPGDPYGGPNGSTRKYLEPNSDINKPESAVRHVIDGGMATTMLQHGSEVTNDEGKGGYLNKEERDAMAIFLLDLSHKPPRHRAFTDELSDNALIGIERFHVTGNRERKNLNTMVCGSCHTMPYLATDQNSMNVPSFRGALDRFILQAQGRGNVISLVSYKKVAEKGWPAEEVWKRMLHGGEPGRLHPVIDMFKESSTGFSGAFGRQVTLSQATADDSVTLEILSALEKAAMEGTIVLKAHGTLTTGRKPQPLSLTYVSRTERFAASEKTNADYAPADLIKKAAGGQFTGTFTAYHPRDAVSAPPAIWTTGSLHKQRGSQLFPRVNEVRKSMKISARHLQEGASLFVNGRRVKGSIRYTGEDLAEVAFESLPGRGLNMLQVQNPGSYLSNEFIFYVETEAEAVRRYEREPAYLLTAILNSAIVNNNPEEARLVLRAGASFNDKHEHFEFERPPLILAALYGRSQLVDELLRRGADPNIQDKNGITALHEAARLCRLDICRNLLAAGASSETRNKWKERPADLTGRFVRKGHFEEHFAPYRVNLPLNHERYLRERPQVDSLFK